jgi:carbohydrate-binding DOMON domain-containing protein
MIDDDTFWCGDEYQKLREYEILQQPPSAQEDTPTATATNTSTATPTSTQTPTATNVPTNASTNTTVVAQSFTATPRPKMGGDGNFNRGNALSLFLGFLMIGIGISLTVVDWKHYISPFKKG